MEVDYNPSPKEHYFISISLNENEVISFDNTTKGHRVIKQVLVEKQTQDEAVKKYGKITGGWDTIVLEDGKFVQKYHIEWIDKDKLDIVNGETWKTVWEKTLDKQLGDKLLYFSQLISDHYNELEKFPSVISEFEILLSKEITKQHV